MPNILYLENKFQQLFSAAFNIFVDEFYWVSKLTYFSPKFKKKSSRLEANYFFSNNNLTLVHRMSGFSRTILIKFASDENVLREDTGTWVDIHVRNDREYGQKRCLRQWLRWLTGTLNYFERFKYFHFFAFILTIFFLQVDGK